MVSANFCSCWGIASVYTIVGTNYSNITYISRMQLIIYYILAFYIKFLYCKANIIFFPFNINFPIYLSNDLTLKCVLCVVSLGLNLILFLPIHNIKIRNRLLLLPNFSQMKPHHLNLRF
jgi:hypothetical protein